MTVVSNRSGELSIGEVKVGLDKLGVRLKPQELEAIYDHFDSSGDGLTVA